MKELKLGQKLRTVSDEELEVLEKLGEGGQGIVYKVRFGEKNLALKWYFANKLKDPNRFYQNLQNNIRKGAPDKAFLWPLELTEQVDGSFGYLMELCPPDYQDFSKFLLAKVRFSSIAAVMNAALCITSSFRMLHNAGFSYQDLNDGNFFIHPGTGDVLICDNDNVAEYGDNLGIAGKCRYMAPEVVLGKKKPDIHTDRFSLAVILYLLLFLNHPLEGKKTMCPCLTEELEQKFYGRDPVFVWDRDNDTNRPVRGVHVNERKLWPLYPQFVRDTFVEAFSREAMIGNDTEHRVTEKKWQEIFTLLRDSLMVCDCGGETFVDPTKTKSICINCGKNRQRPMVLHVKKYHVVLSPGKKLYRCHSMMDQDDFRKESGSVIASRSHPHILGLKNESDWSWTAILPNGAYKQYKTGEVIRLAPGLKIHFGNENEGIVM